MNRHPLDLERFIGWVSIAVGASALRANDSIFYAIARGTGAPLVWASAYALLGLALILSTYTVNARCRIVLLVVLSLMWFVGLLMVLVSGPLGAFGAVSIVIVLYAVRIVYMKVTSGD